jgi:hypothetical protein
MTVSFKDDNDVIVYALEKIIEYTRRTQQILVAQCVWWLASIVGLEQGLIHYIDNLYSRIKITVTSEPIQSTADKATEDTGELQQDQVLKECKEYLKKSRRLRNIATSKSKGKTLTGRSDPTQISKKALRKNDRSKRKQAIRSEKGSQTASIDEAEIQRRKKAGQCLQCAWPPSQKGTHGVQTCIRPIKLVNGTAPSPKANQYQQQPITRAGSCDAISFKESSDDSL